MVSSTTITGSWRTVDRDGNTIETWKNRREVKPTRDYHEIQGVSDSGEILCTCSSMYDFLGIPF